MSSEQEQFMKGVEHAYYSKSMNPILYWKSAMKRGSVVDAIKATYTILGRAQNYSIFITNEDYSKERIIRELSDKVIDEGTPTEVVAFNFIFIETSHARRMNVIKSKILDSMNPEAMQIRLKLKDIIEVQIADTYEKSRIEKIDNAFNNLDKVDDISKISFNKNVEIPFKYALTELVSDEVFIDEKYSRESLKEISIAEFAARASHYRLDFERLFSELDELVDDGMVSNAVIDFAKKTFADNMKFTPQKRNYPDME